MARNYVLRIPGRKKHRRVARLMGAHDAADFVLRTLLATLRQDLRKVNRIRQRHGLWSHRFARAADIFFETWNI